MKEEDNRQQGASSSCMPLQRGGNTRKPMSNEEPPRVETHESTKNLHTQSLKITVQGACTFKHHYKELATKKPVEGMDVRYNLQGRQVSLGKINSGNTRQKL
jgi:hypothetical protein